MNFFQGMNVKSDADSEKLFQRTYFLRSVDKTAHYGLAIMKKHAEVIGGTFIVKSEPDAGCKICMAWQPFSILWK